MVDFQFSHITFMKIDHEIISKVILSLQLIQEEHLSVTGISVWMHKYCITKTSLYDFDPLKHHFYIIKLGFTGV